MGDPEDREKNEDQPKIADEALPVDAPQPVIEEPKPEEAKADEDPKVA
jgi:hypothetical protein